MPPFNGKRPISLNDIINNCRLNPFGLIMGKFSFEMQCLNTIEQTRTIVRVMP